MLLCVPTRPVQLVLAVVPTPFPFDAVTCAPSNVPPVHVEPFDLIFTAPAPMPVEVSAGLNLICPVVTQGPVVPVPSMPPALAGDAPIINMVAAPTSADTTIAVCLATFRTLIIPPSGE
jgi:hypothetical protein